MLSPTKSLLDLFLCGFALLAIPLIPALCVWLFIVANNGFR